MSYVYKTKARVKCNYCGWIGTLVTKPKKKKLVCPTCGKDVERIRTMSRNR